MEPQKAALAESSTASGSSRTASAAGSSKPTCSSTASGGGDSVTGSSTGTTGLSGTASATSGGGGPGTLSNDISGISFLTALSSAGKLDSLNNGAEHPKPEAVLAWTTACSPKKVAPAAGAAAEEASLEPHDTDLDHFHAEASIERSLANGHYAKVKGLADCCRNDGKVELHRWHEAEREEDRIVVVKRILSSRVYANRGLEANERTVHRRRLHRDSEDTLTEIGVYCLLARQRDLPEYLLRMHTVFEAGPDVWLVLEHADGGDLFGVMQQADGGQGLPKPRLVRWMWQLMQAVKYLHRHRIGHRDISMENVLLRGDAVRLMDFGQSVLTHSSAGTVLRYFVPAGKPYYRSPDCYVPTSAEVQVAVPAGARPGDIVFTKTIKGEYILEARLPASNGAQLAFLPGSHSPAEPVGYAAAPADVFACGVVFFILTTGLPPWRQATPSDGHFGYCYAKGIPMLLQAWDRQLPAMEQELLVSMMRWDPSKRPTAEDCLAHQWFAPLQGTSVPTHRAAAALPVSPPATPMVEGEAAGSSGGLAVGTADPQELARLIQGLTAGGQGGGSSGDAYAGRENQNQWSDLIDDWAELVDQTGFSADYYCRPEVCRGERAGLEEASLTGAPLAPAAGDFYGSLAEEHVDLAAGVDEAVRKPPVPLGLPLQLELARQAAGAAAPPAPGGTTARFSDEEVPLEAPEAEGFRFEPTTLHVCGCTPADVGNHLLTFLTTVVGAQITKVNCRKFTMKASAQGDAGAFSLKIRIYREGAGRQAVEFQRRGGDAVALHLLYQRAVEYLEHLVQALTPEGSRPSSRTSERSEVDASPLQDWADPGVKGLLKRNRRKHLDPPAPRPTQQGSTDRSAKGCHSYGRQLVLAR